jgi:hypothetical protein
MVVVVAARARVGHMKKRRKQGLEKVSALLGKYVQFAVRSPDSNSGRKAPRSTQSSLLLCFPQHSLHPFFPSFLAFFFFFFFAHSFQALLGFPRPFCLLFVSASIIIFFLHSVQARL